MGACRAGAAYCGVRPRRDRGSEDGSDRSVGVTMPDGRSMRSCDPETNYTAIDSGRMCLAASETPSPVDYQAPASSNERAWSAQPSGLLSTSALQMRQP